MRITRTIGTATVAAMLLAGCTDSPTESSSKSGSGSGSGSADGGDRAGDAGVEDVDADDVIVEQTVAAQTGPDDEVTLGVQSLTVQGEVMVLRVVVTPDFASVSDDQSVSLFGVLNSSTFQPVLVDVENLKEYSPIRDPGVTWTADNVELKSTGGSPMVAWAYYAAPEDDIDSVDIRVTDYWPSFTDVPITR